MPVPIGAHMIVFIGYSEDGCSFNVYDPGDVLNLDYLFTGKLLLFEKLRELILDGRDYLLIKKE